MPNATRIALANQKGGVGKTTSCFALAAAKAKTGAMVLMIDLDPQYSLTESCGMMPDDTMFVSKNTCNLFSKKTDLLKCCFNVKAVKLNNLFIVPATQDLAMINKRIFTKAGIVNTFRSNIDTLSRFFDYIFIDCPPQLDGLLTSALAAADKVVVPVKAERLSYKGLKLITGSINEAKTTGLNPALELTGLVITMYRQQTREHTEYLQKMEQEENNILGIVPLATVVTKELDKGKPCTVAHPTSNAAKAYFEIANKL